MAGFLFKSESITYRDAFFYLGISVILISIITFFTKFIKSTQETSIETNQIETQVLETA
jgi:NNP family nitrate/nitrite transporter-like MFS transporter